METTPTTSLATNTTDTRETPMMDGFNFLTIEQSTELGELIDIQLNNIDTIREYDKVEMDIVFYPYTRDITPDNYEIEPFADYTQANGHKAAQYRKRQDPYANGFGALLGGLLTSIVGYKNPENIRQIESLFTIG